MTTIVVLGVVAIDFVRATSLVGQTTLRSILGQSDLDYLLTERDRINQRLQEVIDQQTSAMAAPWRVWLTRTSATGSARSTTSARSSSWPLPEPQRWRAC